MTIYFIQLVLLIAFAVVFGIKGVDSRLIYLGLSFSTLFLISGFRAYTVGTDTFTYFHEYCKIAASYSLLDAFATSSISAPVYVAYNWILAQVFSDYGAVILFNAAVTGFAIARFIYKTSPNVVFSTVLFVLMAMYYQSMNGMRQYVAIALAINGYLFLSEHGLRSIKGWGLLCLAIGTHSTSAVLIPAILCVAILRNTKDTKLFLGKVAIIATACVISMGALVELFLRLFPYYAIYNGNENIDVFSNEYGGRIALLYFFLLVIVILGYAKLKKGVLFNPSNQMTVLFPLAIFASIMGIAFSQSFLINRLIWFYLIAFVSFIPCVFSLYSKNVRLLLSTSSIFALLIWWAMQLSENKDGIVPFLFR